MMTPDIRQTYESLPLELQREAADFIEFLAQKWRRGRSASQPTAADASAGRTDGTESVPAAPPTMEEIAERRRQGLGSLKGQIWMSDDFDEPLEDFKEYM